MGPGTALRLTRPFTWLAPTVGVVCGARIATHATGIEPAMSTLALAVLGAVAASAASNAWNQAFDVELDRVNKPTRPLPSGDTTARAALLLGHALALVGLACAFFVGSWFFACVTVGTFATWIYSAPPTRTKRLPWGALLTIAVPRGGLVPVAGWSVVTIPTQSDPWALGAVGALYVFGATVTKDFADVKGDRAFGCNTLPVLLGADRAARLIAPALIVPFLLYPLLAESGYLGGDVMAWAVLGVVLAAVGAVAAWSLRRDPERLVADGGNHPAWILMYLLLLGSHIGSMVVYARAVV